MAARRWLSIVVDGSTAMAPYWRKIVSDYLVNIVRSFFGKSRGQGGYPTCEVGLIMYNPNPSLDWGDALSLCCFGFYVFFERKECFCRNVHFINWTSNMDQFLALLPFLSFRGDNNQSHTAAEDEITVTMEVTMYEPWTKQMFPRDRMTEKEYFQCERHCIFVATGEPVAERMLVPLPRGNSLDKSTPIMDYGNGQITVLLSDNFKDAKNVHCNKGTESMKTTTSIPINFTNSHQGDQYSASSMNIGQPSIQGFQNVRRESASKRPLVASQATTNEMHAPSPGCFVPMNSYEEIMSILSNDNNNCQEDQPRKKSKTFVPTSEEEDSLAYLFQLDQPVSLDEILGQGQTMSSETQVGGESSEVLRDIVPQTVTRDTTSTIQLTSNSSEIVVYNANTSSVGEGSSNGLAQELGGNMSVVNPMFSSENCLNYSLSLPQNNQNFWPAGSNALYPPQTAASFGDSTFLNTIGNSNTQFESPSFPMHPYACANASLGTSSHFGNSLTQFQSPNSTVNPYDCASVGASNLVGNSISQYQPPSFSVHPYGGIVCASASTDAIVVASAANANAGPYASPQQFTKPLQFEMSGINPQCVPSAMVANPLASPVPMTPQYNQTQFLPHQPFLPGFKDFVPTWEGYLVGSIDPYCAFFNQAKAWRKKTSNVTLTYQWSTTLEIGLYLPKKAVIHTMRTYGGIPDDLLFEVTQFDNLDLYHYLTSNNVCAKIALPSLTLVLSTTENKHCYMGSIFPGDAVFVEPV
ncbi:hypothetical protein VNO80_23245 [Phaseolus coccineus]|uniref:Mediator of RNA polymerase II transcription subunit 25 n=1 Tax=Phaseolus coccineus TaxID=3886 RepID=A0AAN9QVM5_PHACN